jgi:Domain of unknown function (DUF1963)
MHKPDAETRRAKTSVAAMHQTSAMARRRWPFGRRKREREARERVAAHFEARAERTRRRAARAATWRSEGSVTPERVLREYEARRDDLDPDIAALARPVAAWVLRAGEPRVDSSHMGGAPALHPDEPWPEPDNTMRFWAQLNLADLAPFGSAYGIAMPSDGLLQLFAADSGGELARYVPAAELGQLELRRDIPRGTDWFDDELGRQIEATSLLIDLHPEALVGGEREVDVLYPDLHGPRRECSTSDDLPGYCFGWWPFSRPDDPDALTYLAVCNSNRDLGLAFSDSGFLWTTIPTADLAAGDFTRLECEGESS